MNNGGAVNITEDQKERMRIWDIFRLYGFVLAKNAKIIDIEKLHYDKYLVKISTEMCDFIDGTKTSWYSNRSIVLSTPRKVK